MNNVSHIMIVVMWVIEYIISLYLAFLVFAVNVKKRNHGILRLSFSFIVLLGFWACRQIPGYNHKFDIVMYLSVFAMMVFFGYLCLKINFYQSVFIVGSTLCLQHLAYGINFTVISLIDINLRSNWYYFLSYFLIMAFTYVLVYFLFGRKLKNKEIQINSITTLIVTTFVIVATIVISFYTQEPLVDNLADEKAAFALINFSNVILSVAGLVILFLNLVSNTLKEENKMLGILLKKDKTRYETAKIEAEKINIKYHDMKHVMAQQQLNNEIGSDELKHDALMYSGSNALDIILMEKQLLCEKQKCTLTSIIDGSLLSFMKPYHIYSMFGNILDNAIESASKEENPEKRNIKLSVQRIRNNIVIIADNFTKSQPKVVDGLPVTTKTDKENHGYGLKSIKNIVELNDGVLGFSVNDDVFEIKIIFPYREPVLAK